MLVRLALPAGLDFGVCRNNDIVSSLPLALVLLAFEGSYSSSYSFTQHPQPQPTTPHGDVRWIGHWVPICSSMVVTTAFATMRTPKAHPSIALSLSKKNKIATIKLFPWK